MNYNVHLREKDKLLELIKERSIEKNPWIQDLLEVYDEISEKEREYMFFCYTDNPDDTENTAPNKSERNHAVWKARKFFEKQEKESNERINNNDKKERLFFRNLKIKNYLKQLTSFLICIGLMYLIFN